MHDLNQLYEVDTVNNTITVGAGMSMRELYNHCKEHGMAIPSMPNIDSITVGGAVSNGTHGTNRNYGSSSNLVLEIELLTWNAEKGEVETVILKRNSSDQLEQHLFDAALVNFGSLGIITKLKLRTVQPYYMMVDNTVCNTSKILSNYFNLVHSFDCFMLVIQPQDDFKNTVVRTQT